MLKYGQIQQHTLTNNRNRFEPIGEYSIPMALSQIGKFENLNKTNWQVFGWVTFILFLKFQKDDLGINYVFSLEGETLITVRISKNIFDILNQLSKSCRDFEQSSIQMPSEKSKEFKFNTIETLWFAPLVVFFDFESFLATPPEPTPTSNTETLVVHQSSGYAFLSKEKGHPAPRVLF